MSGNEFKERKGYLFGGWYIDQEYTKRLNPGGILPHEITLYDKWTLIDYTVTYQLHGGINSKKNPTTVNVESGLIKLYPAYKEGYVFDHWSLKGRPITLIPAQIYEDITIEAHFRPLSHVFFETRGGGVIEEKIVDYTEHLEPFRPPIKMGYEFENWYWDPRCQYVYTFDQPIRKSCILYANWKVQTFQITYDANGGFSSRTNPKSYTYFDKQIVLKPAQKKGYRFLGWFDSRGNIQNVILPYSIGDKHFIAHYEKLD